MNFGWANGEEISADMGSLRAGASAVGGTGAAPRLNRPVLMFKAGAYGPGAQASHPLTA